MAMKTRKNSGSANVCQGSAKFCSHSRVQKNQSFVKKPNPLGFLGFCALSVFFLFELAFGKLVGWLSI